MFPPVLGCFGSPHTQSLRSSRDTQPSPLDSARPVTSHSGTRKKFPNLEDGWLGHSRVPVSMGDGRRPPTDSLSNHSRCVYSPDRTGVPCVHNPLHSHPTRPKTKTTRVTTSRHQLLHPPRVTRPVPSHPLPGVSDWCIGPPPSVGPSQTPPVSGSQRTRENRTPFCPQSSRRLEQLTPGVPSSAPAGSNGTRSRRTNHLCAN